MEKLSRRISGAVLLLAAPEREIIGVPGSKTREYDRHGV